MENLRTSIIALTLAACTSLFLTSCGEDDGGGSGAPATGCDACTDGQVCVTYLGGDEDDREECADAPAECGETPECAVDACRGATYGLCEEGWIGVGCSDTFPPLIVSCNPSR